MEFGINYNTSLIERCRMLSSYEASGMTDGEGESLFLDVRIVGSDIPLLREYFSAAALTIEENLGSIVLSAAYDNDGFTWNLRLGSRWRGNNRVLRKYIEEAMTNYAMAQWMAKKGNDKRSAVYLSVWNDMLGKCVSMAFRTKAPVKRRRPPYLRPDAVVVDDD